MGPIHKTYVPPSALSCSVFTCVCHYQRIAAQKVLTEFQDHPDAWSRVDSILEYSKNVNTKFYALGILESVIKYKWKALPREQCEGIKNYIVGLVIKLGSDEASLASNQMFLSKLNFCFVQVYDTSHFAFSVSLYI